MIISKNYDISIWYMINSSSKYGRNIKDFIIELPIEFIKKLRTIINNQTSNNLIRESQINNLITGYVVVQKNIIYHYTLCQKNGTLILCKAILKDERYVLTFELVLTPFNLQMIKNNKKFIGSVTNYFSSENLNNEYLLSKNYIFKTKKIH